MQHFHPLLRAHAWCGSKTCACVVALQPYDYASTAVARTWALHTAMRARGVHVCACCSMAHDLVRVGREWHTLRACHPCHAPAHA